MKDNFKVLMLLKGLNIGGTETHVVELSKALKKLGIEVYVASSGGLYVDEILEAGIKHFYVPLGTKNPLNWLKSYFALGKIIKKNAINIVHGHARIPNFICGLLQKKLKFQFVTTCHGFYSTEFFCKILCNWGDKTFAVREDLKKYLMLNYKVEEKNISVTINGIDSEKFSNSTDFIDIITEFGMDISKKRIVYISRLDVKACVIVHNMLECVENIYAKHNHIEFVIVGDGTDYLTIKKKIDELNKKLNKKIIFLTGARKDIPKFIASGDFIIGVSRVVLEAMCAKKPVILAGPEGYLGIFDNTKLTLAAETNFCCRNCSTVTTQKLEKDILMLLDSSLKQLEDYGNFGRKIVIQNYSLEKMSIDALCMYKKVSKYN